MATATISVDGVPRQLQVPDGLSRGGVQDWLIQQGASPEMVGLGPQPGAETGGFLNEVAIGTGETLTDLMGETLRDLFGLRNDIRGPDTFATDVGRATPAIAAAITVPLSVPALAAGLPAVAAQAGIAGGFGLARAKAEAERTGQPMQFGGAAIDATIAAATQGVAGIAGRFLKGRQVLNQARAANAPVGLPPGTGELGRSTAQALRGGGALSAADDVNRQALNFRAAKALGFGDDVAATVDEFSEDVLAAARRGIDNTYAQAAPTSKVAVGKIKQPIQDLIDRGLPDGDLNKVLDLIGDRVTIDAAEWQGIQSALRGVSTRTGRNTIFGGLKGQVDDIVGTLDDAAAASGGDKALLTQANTRFKVLSTLEEINAVVETGQIPAGELVRKLGRTNFKGIGRRAIAETGQIRDPALRELVQTGKAISRFGRETAGGSATAGRLARFGATGIAARAAAGAAVGGPTAGLPGLIAGAGVGLAAPPILGRALLAPTGGALERFVGPGVAQVFPRLFDEPEEDQPGPASGP